MIKIDHITKKFGDKIALDDLCMLIPDGSIYGLMGLNGAGKTTIIKHIAGYLNPDSGSITIDDEDVRDNEKIREKVVFIPDDLYFFKSYSLKEMGKYYKKIYPDFSDERFNEMVYTFGLDMKGNIGKFSKGMKKQAAFSLAMSAMPNYLVLDEPVDGLDPIVRHKLWGYIMSDCAERGMTVLVSSHNAKEMGDACNYVGILADGKMIFEGDILDIDEPLEELFIETVENYEREVKGVRF